MNTGRLRLWAIVRLLRVVERLTAWGIALADRVLRAEAIRQHPSQWPAAVTDLDERRRQQ